MRCTLVSHTHWDREWYRTFQAFRARLVDTVDRVLDLIAEDSGFHFQLDGQSIVIEDYLEVRPQRRDELEAACRAGRVAVGPWYVQPDSLLPSGEAHIRNLLEGRRVAQRLGACSTIAYTPDSFGHPAQLPQIFAGFGLDPFIYWRGNGNEADRLPSEYHWRAPDGSMVRACLLRRGYFAAFGLERETEAAVARLEGVARELATTATSESVLLMNGVDHMLPDANTREVCEGLAKATGWEVQRGLLDDFADSLRPLDAEFEGELLGARLANLLPGVWSTRTALKSANRRCESALEGWAEPASALLRLHGGPDEGPSLRSAWRSLLPNHAHDSICGCSQDRVHRQMESRFDDAEGLAHETTTRALDRLSGHDVERQPAPGAALEVAVFNPSTEPRSGIARLALEGYPAFSGRGIHPLLLANFDIAGFTVGGRPARVVPHAGNVRPHLKPEQPVHDLEFLVDDLPPMGWRRLPLVAGDATPDEEDAQREIRADDVRVRAEADGTLSVAMGGREWRGLCGVEDTGDRGDTYDYDPVPGPPPRLRRIETSRLRHPSGIQRLRVRRELELPAALAAGRDARSDERVICPLVVEARVAPGLGRVELTVELENTARDHRLRLLFPSGEPARDFTAATTLDVARRRPGKPDDTAWIHPAPTTFPHQGWVRAGGLTVLAPGLQEGEVDPDGTIAITLLRAVGWLSRDDLHTRPGEAGPALPTPDAQCLGTARFELALLPENATPETLRASGLGLRAVLAGAAPLAPPDRPLLSVTPAGLSVSAFKPSEDGGGVVLRLLNSSDDDIEAEVRLEAAPSTARPVRLDESPADFCVALSGDQLTLRVPAHATRSVYLTRKA